MGRIFRNLLLYFKGIKEVRESEDSIYFKCPKCRTELKALKNYGKLHIICKCGYSVNVYTGKDTHFHNDSIPIKKDIIIPSINNEERAINKFKKHIHEDLNVVYDLLHNDRNITKIVSFRDCNKILKGKPQKSGFENVVKYLADFCDLSSTPIHVVWKPLDAARLLSTVSESIDIMGTTYIIPMGSVLYYSIFLNPKFISNTNKMLAVVAHELSHVYASVKNITFISPNEDRGNKEYAEQITDLLAIGLGMGKIMCYLSEERESPEIGYLTNEMVCYANNIWENIYLSGKTNNLTTVINCNNCSQKLRIPIRKGKLNLVCPKCKTNITYKY